MIKKFKTFIYKNRKDLYAIIGLIFLAIITHRAWFRFSEIISSGDITYYFEENARNLIFSKNTWLSYAGLGSFNFQLSYFPPIAAVSILVRIGLSTADAMRLVYFLPIALGGFLSPYFFLRKRQVNIIGSFIVSVFYASTPYFIVRQTKHLSFCMSYVLAPIIFHFFQKALKSLKLKDWMKFVIFYQIGIFYEVRFVYIFTFLLGFYFLYKLIKKEVKIFDLVSPISISVTVLTLLNLFWILPNFIRFEMKNLVLFLIMMFLYIGVLIFSKMNYKKLFRAIVVFISIILLSNIFLLLGKSTVEESSSTTGIVTDFYSRKTFGNAFYNLFYGVNVYDHAWSGGKLETFNPQTIKIYSWLIPIAFILGLVLVAKKKKRLKKLGFWLGSLCIALFVSKQNAFPVKGSFDLLRTYIPGFNILRTASMAYIVVAFAYLGTFTILFKNIKGKVAKSVIFLMLLIPSLINFYPTVTGSIKEDFVVQKIDDEYRKLKDMVERDEANFRTLWIPRNSRWTFRTYKHPALSAVGISGITSIENEASIDEVFGKKDLEQYLKNTSIKYIIVPLEDNLNNDNVFKYYSRTREELVGKLDNLRFLEKLEEFEKLDVYEVKNYNDWVFTFNSLEKTNKNFHDQRYFTSLKDRIPSSSYNIDLYDEVLVENYDKEEKVIVKNFEIGKERLNQFSTLYQNWQNEPIQYKKDAGKIEFFLEDGLGLSINDYDVEKKSQNIIHKQKGEQIEYISNGSEIQKAIELGNLEKSLNDIKEVFIYSGSDNLVKNYSFEDSLWNDKVSDCNNYDDSPKIEMKKSSKYSFDGDYSLNLSSKRHIACEHISFEVEPNSKYLLRFNFLSENDELAGVTILKQGQQKEFISEKIKPETKNWNEYIKEIQTKSDTKKVKIWLNAYEGADDTYSNIYYDNIELIPAQTVELKAEESELTIPTNVYKEGNNQILIDLKNEEIKNVLQNGSFEEGLWHNQVIDCHNYDNKPEIDMYISENISSKGDKSIALSSKNHIACTNNQLAYSGGGFFLLNLDVRGENVSRTQYKIIYKTNEVKYETIEKRVDEEWRNFTDLVYVPSQATDISLRISGLEGLDEKTGVTYYDNISVYKVPYDLGKYTLKVPTQVQYDPPPKVEFTQILPTNYDVKLTGISDSFYLGFNNMFAPGWKLEIDGKQSIVSDKFSLNGIYNGWFFDFDEICIEKKLCKKTDDGYSIDLRIDYFPQKLFYVGGLLGIVGFGVVVYFLLKWEPRKVQVDKDLSTVRVNNIEKKSKILFETFLLLVAIFLIVYLNWYLASFSIIAIIIYSFHNVNFRLIMFTMIIALIVSIFSYYRGNEQVALYSLTYIWSCLGTISLISILKNLVRNNDETI